MSILKTLDTGVKKTLYVVTIALFVTLVCIMTANVSLRLINDTSLFFDRLGLPGIAGAIKQLFPVSSLHWFDEIMELSFAALVFYGAAALWAVKGHFSVGDWISPHLPGGFSRSFYHLLVTCLSLAFVGVFFWFSLRLTLRATELSTVFQIPKAWMYACMPISSLIMLAYSIAEVVRNLKAFANGKSGGQRG